MTTPFFVLPSGLVADYQAMVDAFNTTSDFARSCNVIYPAMQQPCQNCIVDTINHCSTNVYNGTGPAPFQQGSICPWCNGAGFFETESKDIVSVRITWKPRDWKRLGSISTEVGNSLIKIRGMLTDLPKFQRCEYLEVSNNLANYGLSRFKRYGDMTPYGIQQDRYVQGFWQKVN